MIRRGLVIVICTTVIGTALAYLSERLLSVGYGVTVLWLGAAVIANASLWFGGWGIVASMLFPFLAGQLQGLELEDGLSALLPNLVEGLMPALAFRWLMADPGLTDRRSQIAYALWAAVLPSALGGTMAAWFWLVLGKVDGPGFRLLSLDWSLSNMAVVLILGFPAASLLTPVLRRRGWLVSGWWS